MPAVDQLWECRFGSCPYLALITFGFLSGEISVIVFIELRVRPEKPEVHWQTVWYGLMGAPQKS